MAWRDITNATNERTVIASIVPISGTDFTLRMAVQISASAFHVSCLLANFNSLVFDFIARQKIGGTHLSDYISKQLAALPPTHYKLTDVDFISSRVMELVYTATDLAPFANDLGYKGKPFAWAPDRRAILRAELDAYYAKLYGLTRDELRYILDPSDIYGDDYPSVTFPGLKRNEVRDFGEYRTRRLVLEAWDQYCAQ